MLLVTQTARELLRDSVLLVFALAFLALAVAANNAFEHFRAERAGLRARVTSALDRVDRARCVFLIERADSATVGDTVRRGTR